jgi:hypothetical protein
MRTARLRVFRLRPAFGGRAAAIVMLLCAGHAHALAQRGAPPPEGPRRYVAIGCISRQAAQGSRYILTDRREPPQAYRLEGEASQLDLHVGHLVEVAGSLSRPPAGGRGPNANAPLLKIASLTWLANSCPKG